MNLADTVKPSLEAVELLRLIFQHYELRLAEVVKYQCEEKPHFDEVKRKDPKAKRSVVDALQHTPDFVEESFFLQNDTNFNQLKDKMVNLKYFDSNQVRLASYVPQGDDHIIVHEALKAISRVRTRNGIFHIPLLDLDIPIDEGGPAAIEEVSLALGIKSGAILDSGRSYHFWGLQLLSEQEWQKFMYKALLLDRIDRRWVGHRLLDGQANLRISEKKQKMPIVVYVF